MRMIAALTLTALALFGCGGGASEDELVGSWTGEIKMSYQSMQGDVMANDEQSAFLIQQETNDISMSLELREDGTCTFQAIGPIEGTWSVVDGQCVMVLPERKTSEGAATFSGTYKFDVDSSSFMSAKDPNVDGVSIRFEK